MKVIRFFYIFISITISVLLLDMQVNAEVGLQDIIKGVKKAAGAGRGLSDGRIIEGLKEALEIGTGNAVGIVSKLDGYYGNPRINM